MHNPKRKLEIRELIFKKVHSLFDTQKKEVEINI